MEETVGGRVGVYALDTGTGHTLARRADERFALCSTFKWVLAAAVLARVDQGELLLDQPVSYSAADMVAHAPVTASHLEQGSLSLKELMAAAVRVSDNPAANLLLGKIGGPAGLTRFVRAHGDEVTRLDRTEIALNTNAPGDVRDTTSPRAMVQLMNTVLLGDALSPGSRSWLRQELQAVETGKHRLRAGLPENSVIGDKTGTGGRGAVQDVAICTPPGRKPWLIAVYLSDSTADLTVLEGAHAALGALIAQHFT
jgi:beta-lactamase class A